MLHAHESEQPHAPKVASHLDALSLTADGDEVQGQFLSVNLEAEPPEGGAASLARASEPNVLKTQQAQTNTLSARLHDALSNGEPTTAGSGGAVGLSNGFVGEHAVSSRVTQKVSSGGTPSLSSLLRDPQQEFQTASQHANEAGRTTSSAKGGRGEARLKPSEVPCAPDAVGLPDPSLRPADDVAIESRASLLGEPGQDHGETVPRDSSGAASDGLQAGPRASPSAYAGRVFPDVLSAEPLIHGVGESSDGDGARVMPAQQASGADPAVGARASVCATPQAALAGVDNAEGSGFPPVADRELQSGVLDAVGGGGPGALQREKGIAAEGQGIATPGMGDGDRNPSARIQAPEAQGTKEETNDVAEEGSGARPSVGTQGSRVSGPLTESLQPLSDGTSDDGCAEQPASFPSEQSHGKGLPSVDSKHVRLGLSQESAEPQGIPQKQLQASGTSDGPLRPESPLPADGVCDAHEDGALTPLEERQGGAGEASSPALAVGAGVPLQGEALLDVTAVRVSCNEDVDERTGHMARGLHRDTGPGAVESTGPPGSMEVKASLMGLRARSLDMRSQMSWMTVEEAAARPVSPLDALDEEERIARVSGAACPHALGRDGYSVALRNVCSPGGDFLAPKQGRDGMGMERGQRWSHCVH